MAYTAIVLLNHSVPLLQKKKTNVSVHGSSLCGTQFELSHDDK